MTPSVARARAENDRLQVLCEDARNVAAPRRCNTPSCPVGMAAAASVSRRLPSRMQGPLRRQAQRADLGGQRRHVGLAPRASQIQHGRTVFAGLLDPAVSGRGLTAHIRRRPARRSAG
ncbi:MAG: hypothetical protein JWQ76_2433 [Ramlibacter sp.]|nr:hypothetical protein [Ramlibacter sp.]